jgi:hypothetical protein
MAQCAVNKERVCNYPSNDVPWFKRVGVETIIYIASVIVAISISYAKTNAGIDMLSKEIANEREVRELVDQNIAENLAESSRILQDLSKRMREAEVRIGELNATH